MKLKKLIGIMAIAGLAVPGIASATNGYFSHGYGIKAKGMGGAGIAFGQDALAAATNPANMVLVGDRIDLGIDWFRPIRQATIGDNSAVSTTYKSSSNNFLIPEFGYNKMISNDMSLGISVYGNGGMNSDYEPIGNYNQTGNRTGVDLSQLFIAPTWAMKINPNHAIGVSLNLAYQQFAASGISNFGQVSQDATKLSDRGHDSSTGFGVRLGWTGQITPDLTLGATYQSKTKMSKMNEYKGLFAGNGSFDIPENYGIGLAFKANPATTIAFDVVKINYSGVPAIANTIANMGVSGSLLGQDNGIGFGWKDMTVYKLGVSYDVNKDLTIRAGYNHGATTIPDTEIAFNVLAPATVENHLTLGATWKLANKAELSLAYMHAFSKSQSGATPQLFCNPMTGCMAGTSPTTTSTINMKQDSLGIAYGWKM